jgi:hypothetical protein
VGMPRDIARLVSLVKTKPCFEVCVRVLYVAGPAAAAVTNRQVRMGWGCYLQRDGGGREGGREGGIAGNRRSSHPATDGQTSRRPSRAQRPDTASRGRRTSRQYRRSTQPLLCRAAPSLPATLPSCCRRCCKRRGRESTSGASAAASSSRGRASCAGGRRCWTRKARRHVRAGHPLDRAGTSRPSLSSRNNAAVPVPGGLLSMM